MNRFATSKNQALRIKANTTLQFENLPNVGKVRAISLLEKFKTLDELAVAEPEAVSTAAKCSIEQAKEIIASAKIVSALSAKDAKDMPHTHTNTAKQKSQSKKIANLAKAALED